MHVSEESKIISYLKYLYRNTSSVDQSSIKIVDIYRYHSNVDYFKNLTHALSNGRP